ncbi:helix-turn-helix transcriptional regulator [Planotetraspora sp. A-T 1434]|uniref:helix-turn-helix transcriptional regulator n=1 Tax=Planotetraspora sp. A-T 1434 TaxID=2979219 RepID=UPI0021BFF5F2|nr:helix-turn-helix transcriptional regulator [Planotetraspora sp. A-T 1434]MCT9931851.1 helix-turn-helix transcriptional regulator [Planotetraspora sp. A-T 1434]
MDSGSQLGQFIRARRAAITPAEVGLPNGGPRRTTGLRREEVAMLAGLSEGYYARLEQGREKNPSDQVLEALIRVFGLNADAAEHLYRLSRRESGPRIRHSPQVRPHILRLIEGWSATPALVVGPRLDVLAANALGMGLYSVAIPDGNLVRFTFVNPAAREFYRDWDEIARTGVAALRATAGADPNDPELTHLVVELSARSAEFRQLWGHYDVQNKTYEVKRFRHPEVGDLTLIQQSFNINGVPGQQLVTFQTEPGSPGEEGLALLSSLVASRLPDRTRLPAVGRREASVGRP